MSTNLDWSSSKQRFDSWVHNNERLIGGGLSDLDFRRSMTTESEIRRELSWLQLSLEIGKYTFFSFSSSFLLLSSRTNRCLFECSTAIRDSRTIRDDPLAGRTLYPDLQGAIEATVEGVEASLDRFETAMSRIREVLEPANFPNFTWG